MGSAYVIGLGRSGLAAARLLRAEGFEVYLSDRGDSEALREQQRQLAQQGITVQLGHTFALNQLKVQPDLVVVSPGVPWDIPGLVEARAQGLDVVGELALAWRFLREVPWLCITGTNGKTTTTALVEAMFKAAGKRAIACGNIGHAACEVAYAARHGDDPTPLDWVIAEISSYQIEAGQELIPQIGIWTTFTPDHLSRHHTLENYYNIKAHLLAQSRQRVLNGDDPHLRETLGDRWPEAHWTAVGGMEQLPRLNPGAAYLEEGWVKVRTAEGSATAIVKAAELTMQGEHNQQNLLLAAAAARLAGIEPGAIAQAIRSFPGVPHRLERVGTWRGITLINDSKATNYDAAEVGLAAVPAPVILLAGGEAKAGDDTGWLQQIQKKAAAVVVFGAAADEFAARLRAVGYEKKGYEGICCCETLDEAIAQATQLSIQLSTPPSTQRSTPIAPKIEVKTILLSPACASFDQYASFEQRGDHFRTLCQGLMATP